MTLRSTKKKKYVRYKYFDLRCRKRLLRIKYLWRKDKKEMQNAYKIFTNSKRVRDGFIGIVFFGGSTAYVGLSGS